ncbi:hypothetical protein GXP67_35180 [Rhodocytophaga rosea]|uniref:Uncharacterized protein n=1 Tax=Rhodocytophaga rosea TaxID=2704465 RepID=A0A6C0GU15_9BACT|nr:VirB3 family type IV secretion system protein [Rhodocytophaga rosea]QHT71536.1 hypothetical protein GXP67_35180 [Rhodocytophaga rosea]
MTNNTYFKKVWGMPILLALITLAGLIFAILGTGIWHILSWVSLFVPIYIMCRYGKQFFESNL